MKWLFFFVPKKQTEDKPKRTLTKKELSPKQKHFLKKRKNKSVS